MAKPSSVTCVTSVLASLLLTLSISFRAESNFLLSPATLTRTSGRCCRGWSSHSPPRRWPHGLEACCCPSLSHHRSQCFCKYNLLMSELISMEIFYSRTFGSLTLDLTCSAGQWGSRWEWRQQALSWACCSCGSVVNQVVIKVIV